MTTTRADVLLRHVRSLVADETGHLRDGQLLQRFADGRDEAAFAALVRRHGPLVLGVCRRVLGNWHDAEDAFQATFLVLARKAGSIAKRESVGGWLYQVAYHMAIRARKRAAARRQHERKAAPLSAAAPPRRDGKGKDPLAELTGRELLTVLDEEVQKLPERYRSAVVLCYLEGQTRDQAAQRLGWSLSTLQRRLEAARELLRKRLTRRGGAPSGRLLAGNLVGRGPAPMPAKLVGTAVKTAVGVAAGKAVVGGISSSAVALADGALKAMAATKIKMATAVIVGLGVAALGAGTLARQAWGQVSMLPGQSGQ